MQRRTLNGDFEIFGMRLRGSFAMLHVGPATEWCLLAVVYGGVHNHSANMVHVKTAAQIAAVGRGDDIGKP